MDDIMEDNMEEQGHRCARVRLELLTDLHYGEDVDDVLPLVECWRFWFCVGR